MSAADLQLSTASLSAKPSLSLTGAKDSKSIDKAAKDFEAVFINEFIGSMFDGVSTDGPFGGGPGEGVFRTMLIDQYSKSIANQGGFGLAAAVKSELLHAQENAK
jgi:flagellar protein FlgJ